MDHPSGPDRDQVADALHDNPHLSFFLVPIVTCRPSRRPLRAHEVAMLEGKISFFSGSRSRSGRSEVIPMSVSVLPLQRDLGRLAATYGAREAPVIGLNNVEGVPMPCGTVQLDGAEIMVMVTDLYPAFPPIVLLTLDGADTEQLPISWSLKVAAEDRLVEAIRPFVSPPGPYRAGFGPEGASPLTVEPQRASLARWQRRITAETPELAAGAVLEGLRARTNGVVPDLLRETNVLVFGVGSVGSYIAEQLVRSGVGGISAVDGDLVELANLSRTSYDISDVGKHKVDALAKRLLNINPTLDIIRSPFRVQDLPENDLEELVSRSSLVLAATDDPDAQRLINHYAYSRSKPAVFVGLYAGAKGGEVIITQPPNTACYFCATFMRHSAEALAERVSGNLNYGTGRMVGEIALVSDIHFVSTAAVKCALALAAAADRESTLGLFLSTPISTGQTFLTLSASPHFWFYDSLFHTVAGQHAFQSVWMKPERSGSCIVCGDAANREEPSLRSMRTPNSDAFVEHRSRRSAPAPQ
jgi:hypothetical protein